MQNVDRSVPWSLHGLATQILTMATQLGLVLYFAPWVALALPFLAVAYSAVYRRMRVAARDARRIAALSHTPVFSHFSDALAGRETIAAYGAAPRFREANANRMAELARAQVEA